MSNIGNLETRSNNRATNRISNIGKTKTRTAFDIIAGNNGTFGNLGTTGAGGFDLDIPQIDTTTGNGGGTSFFTQQRKEQTKFDSTYGTNTPLLAKTTTTQNNNDSTTAPNLIIDNTSKPKPTTTTLQFGKTEIPNLSNNSSNKNNTSSNKNNTSSSSPFLNMNGLQIGSNVPSLTTFTTQTGTGVGQATSDLMKAQQDAINSVLDGIETREQNRTARINQEERYNRGQAWGRENEVARITQQNNIEGAREQNRLQSAFSAESDARAFERQAYDLNMQMSNNAAQRASEAGRAMLDAQTSRSNQELVSDTNRDVARTQANASVMSAKLQADVLRAQVEMQQRNFDKEIAFNYEQLRSQSEGNQKNRDLQAFEILTRTPNFNYW